MRCALIGGYRPKMRCKHLPQERVAELRERELARLRGEPVPDLPLAPYYRVKLTKFGARLERVLAWMEKKARDRSTSCSVLRGQVTTRHPGRRGRPRLELDEVEIKGLDRRGYSIREISGITWARCGDRLVRPSRSSIHRFLGRLTGRKRVP